MDTLIDHSYVRVTLGATLVSITRFFGDGNHGCVLLEQSADRPMSASDLMDVAAELLRLLPVFPDNLLPRFTGATRMVLGVDWIRFPARVERTSTGDAAVHVGVFAPSTEHAINCVRPRWDGIRDPHSAWTPAQEWLQQAREAASDDASEREAASVRERNASLVRTIATMDRDIRSVQED